MADPYHYVRLNPGPAQSIISSWAAPITRPGEADDGGVRFEAIEAWIRRLRAGARQGGPPVVRVRYSTRSTIAASSGATRAATTSSSSTGDSGQGMTHGALAGILLRDLIIGGSSRWEGVYDPSRKTASGILNYVSENVTALKNLAEYRHAGRARFARRASSRERAESFADGLSKIAAFRDRQRRPSPALGRPARMLGCNVHWNSTEQCWDCPCHGSQFAPDGSVLNGPAIMPLPVAEAPRAEKRKEEKQS